MNLNKIFSWIGILVGKLNPNDLLEDMSLLSAAVMTFHMTPFDLTSAPTWIAGGVFLKSVLSILSNLKLNNVYISLISKVIAKLNQNDTAEDLGLFAASVKALTLIPVDFHNPVWLTAAGLCFKAGISLLQQLAKPAQ